MSLTSGALDRLAKQADQDFKRPWKPGQQLTDAELIWAYIQKLTRELSLEKDQRFLQGYEDRSGGAFYPSDYEQMRRSEQGIFG